MNNKVEIKPASSNSKNSDLNKSSNDTNHDKSFGKEAKYTPSDKCKTDKTLENNNKEAKSIPTDTHEDKKEAKYTPSDKFKTDKTFYQNSQSHKTPSFIYRSN